MPMRRNASKCPGSDILDDMRGVGAGGAQGLFLLGIVWLAAISQGRE
jgi:hypothetical protein